MLAICKIINFRVYDPDTAALLAEYARGSSQEDLDNYIRMCLFRKRNGEYFLYGAGGANTRYADRNAGFLTRFGWDIEPMTEEQAKDWAEEYAPEKYDEIFGRGDQEDPEEPEVNPRSADKRLWIKKNFPDFLDPMLAMGYEMEEEDKKLEQAFFKLVEGPAYMPLREEGAEGRPITEQELPKLWAQYRPKHLIPGLGPLSEVDRNGYQDLEGAGERRREELLWDYPGTYFEMYTNRELYGYLKAYEDGRAGREKNLMERLLEKAGATEELRQRDPLLYDQKWNMARAMVREFLRASD